MDDPTLYILILAEIGGKMENVLNKPCEMDFDSKNLSATWKKWRQTMMLFMEAVMRNKTEGEKYSTFLYVIGQRGRYGHVLT